MVRVPILRVRIGPYLGNNSLTYWKKGLPEPATWKRFPTIGQPGGPGGRLRRLDLNRRKRKKADKVQKASAVKMVDETAIDEQRERWRMKMKGGWVEGL